MSLLALIAQGGLISQAVAALLLAMSVASWVVIFWKGWLLRRAAGDVARSTAAFWQSTSIDAASAKVAVFDRESLVLPLIAATQARAHGTLATAGDKSAQLTRVLRDALHAVLHKLQFGQVLLATVGSTAPFVGLLGTVWGIYHALTGMAMAGQVTIDKVSGPVGEALIMTAAGLAVAIPAVLAYNVFGRSIGRIEADLEGFAFDLRGLLVPTFAAAHAGLTPALATPAAALASQLHGRNLDRQTQQADRPETPHDAQGTPDKTP
ncbi:biopolymer transport protein ExbB [Polaromonas sp. CG_9.7]|nr:biopolymer transport protein ExbB [Polaromonas sp. CG_9.7]MBG6115211.1 biopolymer transport protein ExbB [Polaromonas sp. CG_9.2]MDH6183435.1 biopolymer transport protein ExbB [Polaromonas sp. CG_23.6]